MSTVVYQGLQSRLESQLMESRTLKLKLSSPKVVFSQSLEMALQSRVIVPADCDSKKLESPPSPNLGGWSSLQTLPNATPCEKLQAPYVHRSTKHYYSSWWLSEKSLNLCTENLGSETGSEFIENSIFSSPACSITENKIQVKREQRQPRNRQADPERKKELPPPLTTLRGADSLQVRPHRENGRLILKATTTPSSSRRCFQVDRSNGRLRLTLTGSPMKFCSSKDEDDKLMNKEDYNKDGKTEKSPEIPCSSYEDENSSMDVGRVEMMKKMWDEQRTAASSCCCRCNESHKNNNNNNNAKKKAMMTSMVKLEPHFLVASS